MPGPGNYTDETNTFGKAAMGGHMGQKHVTQIKMMPGPGDYDANDKMTKTSARGVAINQAERTELWVE